MPDSSWQRAYEQNAEANSAQQRAEQLQSNAEGAGLMGAVGFMAMAAIAPMALKSGLKQGVKMAGRRAARSGGAASKGYRAVKRRADDMAKKAGQTAGSAEDHTRRAIQESTESLSKRASLAAERQYRSGDSADLTQFLGDVGFSGPSRLRKGASDWRQFTQSAEANKKGALRAFMQSDNQRKLLSSRLKDFGAEQAAAFPATYAVDSALGVTGAPSDTPWYDAPGQVQGMIEYLPRYAGYEVAGAAAFGAPGLAKGAGRAAKQYLSSEGQGAARAVSSAFSAASEAGRVARRASSELENRYQQNVKTAPSAKMLQRGYSQTKDFALSRAKQAQSSVESFMSRRTSRIKRDPTKTASTLRGAKNLFGSRGGIKELTDFVAEGEQMGDDARDVGAAKAMQDVKGTLFAEPGEDAQSFLGGVFGGKTVRIGDIGEVVGKGDKQRFKTTASGINLTQKAEEELLNIKQGIDSAKERVSARSSNTTDQAAAQAVQDMSFENLRVSGYSKIGGEIMRMPTGQDAMAVAGRALESVTKVRDPSGTMGKRGGFSISNIVGGNTFFGRTAAVSRVKGPVSSPRRSGPGGKMQNDLFYFGSVEDGSVPAKAVADTNGQLYERGLMLKKSGFRKHRIYGQKTSGKTHQVGDFFVPSQGKTKAHDILMRPHKDEEAYYRSKKSQTSRTGADPMSTVGQQFNSLKETLSLGSSESSIYQRARDYISGASPRRLLSEDSDLWNTNLTTAKEAELAPVADAMHATRQAAVNATDAYTNPQVFSKALKSVGIEGDKLDELGGVQGILTDDEKALDAAKHVMKNVTDTLNDEADRALRSPTTPVAKRYIKEAGADPDSLYNKFGEKRSQTLRRYIFEQGAIGNAHGKEQTGKMMKELDSMAKKGQMDPDVAKEAQAGLVSLEMQVRAGRRLKNPYQELRDKGAQWGNQEGVQNAMGVLKDHKDMLGKFAATRPRMDVSYNRDPYTAPDGGGSFGDSGFFAADYSMRTMATTYLESGFDTMRRALDEVGLGWSRDTSISTSEGLKEVGKTWTKRGAAAIAASAGYRLLDGGADMMLPDDVPGGEGITTELADIAANARMSASYVYDALGITDAAQYMEGLAPKSTSTLPGAAAGYYATGGILGAVAGATLNRVMQPLMKDTPFESLSILPPLAPFVSDMAESYETTKAEYQGRKWIPQRSGRFYMLSSSNYEGERIESYRPNWYTRQKADVGATPVQYGSKMEEMIFKDLPLIDFAPGDIVDPQYLQKKHRYDRPYASADVPFSEVPVLGPTLGATVGRMYNWMHPLASNGPPTGMETVVGGFDSAGTPRPAIMSSGGSAYTLPSQQQHGHSAYMTQGQHVVGANSASSSFDEQVYRMTEAAGFTGFLVQSAMGGEGLLRDPRTPSASEIDSNARAYHDLQMGDMMGAGEAMRRLMPYERGGARYGPKNTQAEWMPEKNQYGDPYCLLPDTLVEVDEELVPAREAYDLVEEGEHYARTHNANLKEIEAASVREVDEEITRIHVEGLPWELAVTGEHPVLVLDGEETQWKLAKEIGEDDTLLEPVGPEHEEIVYQRYDRGKGHPYQWTIPQNGESVEGLLALQKIEPPPKDRFQTQATDARSEYRIDRAFDLPGCKYQQRRKLGISRLRREMEEKGLPDTLVGASAGALRPLLREWGHLDTDQNELTVEITTDTVRPRYEEWGMYSPYEPKRSDAECVRAATYTLGKALAAAGTAPTIDRLSSERYVVRLRGLSAGKHLFTQHERDVRHSRARNWSGTDHPVVKAGGTRYVKREVESLTRDFYSGPVYAFRVEGDKSFVAAGVATHNSDVPMGEALMPGEGLEATGALTGSEAPLEVENIGANAYDTALRTLDIRRSKGGWAKDAVQKRLMDAGAAVRAEAVYVDEQNDLTAVADAATESNNPIMIEAVSDDQFNSLNGMRAKDRERINAVLGAADRKKGMVTYVNKQTGEVRSSVQKFDSGLYNKSLRKLQQGREMAKKYAAEGYGSPGAMYSTVDRLRVLQNADPFGDQWQVEMRKAKKQYYSGALSQKEQMAFEQITAQHDKMRLPFEMHQKRFSGERLMDPATEHTNLSYNDNVQAAAEYSLPERIAGSVWESATSMRTPLHTKFFGNYSAQEQYENKVLLERDFQSWTDPVDDFVQPYSHGLAAADDPMQGAASYALGGAVFGNPAVGAAGAVVGAAYGAARGAYEEMSGNEYFVPQKIQKTREVAQQMDRIRYYRAKRLYDATGSQEYLDEMQSTATGWTQQGLSGTGWAKDRRRSYSAGARLESDLYNSDRGFSSPYQGLKPVKEFQDAVMKHEGAVQSIGKGKYENLGILGGMMMDLAQWKSPQVGKIAPFLSKKAADSSYAAKQAVHQAAAKSNGVRRAKRMKLSHANGSAGNTMEGMSESGAAKALRSKNTQIQSGRGFGSPYRGEDVQAAVGYEGRDPVQQSLPPELLTMFGAAPETETNFVRPFLMANNPDEQAEILSAVSPDMASMLEVGWNYLHGRQMSQKAYQSAPMKGVEADLTAHPVMGLGANTQSYHIKTLEDTGIAAHDGGIGWKDAMQRMEGALVEPAAIQSVADATSRKQGTTQAELMQIIRTSLLQMGVDAEVSVEAIGGPSEIHLRQET